MPRVKHKSAATVARKQAQRRWQASESLIPLISTDLLGDDERITPGLPTDPSVHPMVGNDMLAGSSNSAFNGLEQLNRAELFENAQILMSHSLARLHVCWA